VIEPRGSEASLRILRMDINLLSASEPTACSIINLLEEDK
jgi:hypothetical protein